MSVDQHPFGNNPDKISGYQSFWNREQVKRPLVGFSFKSWFPLAEFEASAAWQSSEYLTPEMVKPEAFINDQERLLEEGSILDDDILRGASPSQAVPWLCGMLGGSLRILPASILSEERTIPWDVLEHVRLDREKPWYLKYMTFAETLVRAAAGRFPVSHGTLIGPLDLMGMLRGHTRSILDFMEEPEKSEMFLWQIAEIFKGITEELWQRLPLFGGGYFDAQYQLWAPGSIVRLQEDAVAVLSPDLYRRFVQPVDRYLARQFECPFMHLHSTSMFLLDLILEVEEIRCFEVNNDDVAGGLTVKELVPYLQTIQRAGRSLLIRGSFKPDEIRILMDSLATEGLYFYIMVENKSEVETLKPLLGR